MDLGLHAPKGGKREGAGRPLMRRGHQRQRSITLSDELATKARAIGGGVSSGIRKALEAYEP